jgi:hypothetical protein
MGSVHKVGCCSGGCGGARKPNPHRDAPGTASSTTRRHGMDTACVASTVGRKEAKAA